MWTAANQATGDWLLFTDADVLFKPDSLRRAVGLCRSRSRADHVVLFPRMIMKRPGEYMMIAFFQTMFMFGHRPWKVADPERATITWAWARSIWCGARVYDAVGTYEALRMEVLDDMKLGKVVKKAGFAQRNVFGERSDFDPLGEGGVGHRQQSHQELFCRAFVSVVANGDLQRSAWRS